MGKKSYTGGSTLYSLKDLMSEKYQEQWWPHPNKEIGKKEKIPQQAKAKPKNIKRKLILKMRERELHGDDMLFLMECVRCMRDRAQMPVVPENFKQEVEIVGSLIMWIKNQQAYREIFSLIYGQ